MVLWASPILPRSTRYNTAIPISSLSCRRPGHGAAGSLYVRARTRLAGFVSASRRRINPDATRHTLVIRPTNPTAAAAAAGPKSRGPTASQPARAGHGIRPHGIQLTSEIFRLRRASEFVETIRHFFSLRNVSPPNERVGWSSLVEQSAEAIIGWCKDRLRDWLHALSTAHAPALTPDSVRSVIYRASCHRVAARHRVPTGAARYPVATTVWNLRLHSFVVSPQRTAQIATIHPISRF